MRHLEGIKNRNFKWGGLGEKNIIMWSSARVMEGYKWGCNKEDLEETLKFDWWGTYT
jgi:hypothetical protein